MKTTGPAGLSAVNAQELADRWWVLAVRGLVTIAFGVLTLFVPASGLFALIVLFGAFALMDGAANLVMAVRQGRSGEPWGWLVFAGMVSIAAGALTFVWPAMTAMVLLFFIAAWAIVIGIAEMGAAIRLRKEIEGEWMLGGAGLLSIALGVLLFLFPGAGALAMIMVIGAYAVIAGVLMIGLSFRLRSWGKERHESSMPHGGTPRPA